MPNKAGWPDPADPGVPLNPQQPGPHLVVDKQGVRRWAWWLGRDGRWIYEGGGGGGLDWTYVGPALPPDGMPVG
jgi:hypothetical protein